MSSPVCLHRVVAVACRVKDLIKEYAGIIQLEDVVESAAEDIRALMGKLYRLRASKDRGGEKLMVEAMPGYDQAGGFERASANPDLTTKGVNL